jgi:hypothetical protein
MRLIADNFFYHSFPILNDPVEMSAEWKIDREAVDTKFTDRWVSNNFRVWLGNI